MYNNNMPPKRPQTRNLTVLQTARTTRIIQELYDTIDFLSDRINRFNIFIQNNPDAVNLQQAINDRNKLQNNLNRVMIRLLNL